MNFGHQVYYFANPDEGCSDAPTVYSTEAYSEAEARIILGQVLRVTATRLIDVTNYAQCDESLKGSQ